MALFVQQWQEVTNDRWVLSLIERGYKIPFEELPPLSKDPIFFQQSSRPELEEEVSNLLRKRAVECVIPEDPGFYSRIFLVPKKNGKLRLIIDLSSLNAFIAPRTFTMESCQKVRNAILPGDWAFSLDLTDAYLHVPIHRHFRKFLRFTLHGKVYQFRALPFGLTSSPYVFTRLMLVIATYLRRRSITLFPYLDDWLIKNQNYLRLVQDRHFVLQLIPSLGLLINQEKSDLQLSQNFIFIGMEFLTKQNLVRVPIDRIQALTLMVSLFVQRKEVSARLFLSLLGKLNAAADYVELGRLHLRPLQFSLLSQWRPHLNSLDQKIQISPEIRHHLSWWSNEHRLLQGVPLKVSAPKHHLFCDAINLGWGAHLEPEGLLFHGVWTPDQSHLHINLLEMKAITLALHEALLVIRGSLVLVSTDNSTVVSYIRRQGGTHSPNLCFEVWSTLRWCQQHKVALQVDIFPAGSIYWQTDFRACPSLFRRNGHSISL